MKPNKEMVSGGQSLLSLPAPILTYHTIAPTQSGYVYSATCRQFDEHMELLASSMWKRKSSEQTATVTFDDGKATNHEFALPILEKHRIRATFFVTAGLIEYESGFMNWAQIKEIAALGHSVESHGWSHLLLNRVDDRKLYEELDWSKKELEDQLGLAVESISLPGGRWTPQVLRACTNVGYLRVYHSNPWRPPEHWGNMEFLGRFMVRNSMAANSLRDFLEGNRSTILYYRTQHRLKEMGKQLIGDQVYHRIWHTVARLTGQGGLSKDWKKPRLGRNRPR